METLESLVFWVKTTVRFRNLQINKILNTDANRVFQIQFHFDNQFHNILRLFDVLPTFPFTTSETMGDYYL